GVIAAGALLCARGSAAAADDVIATHRAAVGCEARTLLAEARRLLGTAATGAAPRAHLAALVTADTLARRARERAEQDVRLYGHPVADTGADLTGRGGAVLGGILLDGAAAQDTPAAFGGPRTRARRAVPPDA
ncbi:hypothetical protein SZN_29290, partial [Streptomyces zinciresistens K42]